MESTKINYGFNRRIQEDAERMIRNKLFQKTGIDLNDIPEEWSNVNAIFDGNVVFYYKDNVNESIRVVTFLKPKITITKTSPLDKELVLIENFFVIM